MSRLTEKHNDYYISKATCTDDLKLKLGQYEDLEEELGIDLITLFKALRYGIIVVDDNYECHGLSKHRGQEIELNIFLKRLEIQFVGCWNLSDYGKTWWIDKPKEKGNG